MSLNNNNGIHACGNQQEDHQASLAERIQMLEQQLAAKDDAYFELSATMATIRAEADVQVRNIQRDSKLELIKTQEELRRATREANQAHTSLARFQQRGQEQQKPQEPKDNLNPPSTIYFQASVPDTVRSRNFDRSTSSILAQHLVNHCGPPPKKYDDDDNTINNFLQKSQDSDAMEEEDIIWYILRHSIHLFNTGSTSTGSAKKWLKDALMLSPSSRSLLRRACSLDSGKTFEASNSVQLSRIHVDVDLHSVANRLKSPLLKPSWKASQQPSSTNPFDAIICQEWMKQICETPDDWCLVSTVLCDACDVEVDIWYKLFTKGLKERWEIFTQERLGETHVRRIHPLSTKQKEAPISEAAFLESLHLVTRQAESKRREFFDKSVLAILLDLIEYELEDHELEETGDASLPMLLPIFWYISTAFDLKLLRTRMHTTTEDFLAPSGLAVAISVMTISQSKVQACVEREQEERYYIDEGSPPTTKLVQSWKVLRNHTIRLFHQVLRHVQVGRVQLGDEKGLCFSSLLQERRHEYLGTYSQILLLSSIGKDDKLITSMIQLQLEEIEDDREVVKIEA
mmetsp:Transcript_25255/g.37291  ORF Transcript_25255/g.37291 Transcript_25255/m.37291 type:complete len:572 (-) Transcript_25255:746-2461(-)